MMQTKCILALAVLTAGACSVLVAEDTAWFDATVTSWPTDTETTLVSDDESGSWSAAVDGDAATLAEVATYEGGDFTLAGGTLEFTPTEAQKPDLCQPKIVMQAKFVAYEELPEASEVADFMGALIVYDDGVSPAFYGLKQGENGNEWAKLVGGYAAEACEDKVLVSIEHKVEYTGSGYQANNAQLYIRYTIGETVLTLNETGDGWIPLANDNAQDCQLASVGCSGMGVITAPVGTYVEQDYSPTVDFGNPVAKAGANFEGNTVTVDIGSGYDLGRATDLTFHLMLGEDELATSTQIANGKVVFEVDDEQLTIGERYAAKVVASYTDYATETTVYMANTQEVVLVQGVVIGDKEYAWFTVDSEAIGEDVEWAEDPPTSDDAGYLVGEDLVYTPTSHSAENGKVKVELQMVFEGESDEIELSGQAGFKVGTDGEENYYLILWDGSAEVTKTDWPIELNQDYRIIVEIDYTQGKLAYSYGEAGGDMSESAIFDCNFAGNKYVSRLEFNGSMKLASAVGNYYAEGVSSDLYEGENGRYATFEEAIEAGEEKVALAWDVDMGEDTLLYEGDESNVLDLKGHDIIGSVEFTVIEAGGNGTLVITNSLEGVDNSFVLGDLAGPIIVKGGYYSYTDITNCVDSGSGDEIDTVDPYPTDAPVGQDIVASWYCVILGSAEDDPIHKADDIPGGDTGGTLVNNEQLQGFLEEIGVDINSELVTKEDVQAAMQKEAANKMPYWQCYVLGLDPKEPEAKVKAVEVAADTDEGNLTIAVPTVKPTAETGFTVVYKVWSFSAKEGVGDYIGEESTDPRAVKIPLNAGTGRYRVDAVIVPAEAE